MKYIRTTNWLGHHYRTVILDMFSNEVMAIGVGRTKSIAQQTAASKLKKNTNSTNSKKCKKTRSTFRFGSRRLFVSGESTIAPNTRSESQPLVLTVLSR